MRKNPPLTAPLAQGTELLRQVLDRPDHPRFEWHPDLEFREISIDPVPQLVMRETGAMSRRSSSAVLAGLLSFEYDGFVFPHGNQSRGAYVASRRSYVHRSRAAESKALLLLQSELRLRNIDVFYAREMIPGFEVPQKRLAEIVSHLTAAGWKVEVEGKVFRQSTGFKATLQSEIDWFDLVGGLEFGTGEIVRLPELLKALRRGETMVQLSDGSLGMVPEEVVQRFSSLLQFGHVENGQLRFRRNQAGLLDALLSQRPEIGFDEAFATARAGLRNFEKVTSAEQPPGFQGTLREYQREGVAWMQFLQKLGVGGCLADDMGVGKTPQMLALLETRRKFRPDIPPSLAVVPRSLVYNWMQEAAKFTPGLRVLDHTGPDRTANWDRMQDFDLVLSTYGTLRRDAADFRSFEFDYIILDEAQAIKNASSESAKAARLLQGKHRMVLTGTPIENHLGELWSLLEFLNPGMLGASVLQGSGGGSLRNPDEELRTVLARALRPYILRRTKEQVARELPSKIEQTVYCELEGEQKKLYQELRDHYRQTLLGKIDEKGIGRAKLQILEALLRLRQAACHPGLIDKSRLSNESAKLDTLLDQLESVVAEGHKALVFSQFTSLLAIVCERLTEAGITYEYLDGKTRNRQARVERFQTDPKCPVFLISLKAGGVGLNLTAADYVFLLDPWWNPAVEAQAVDRAHRIGQTRQVFTYRLIAKDTVEEKVLLLQEHKKDLANAIIHADEGMVKSLKREDLEILFG
jgi:SNF2 family DNA or RNA helicase